MKMLIGTLTRVNEKNLKIQQLESELSNLRKLSTSNAELNKRATNQPKLLFDNKMSELEETAKEIKDQIKRIKSENIEMEKLISLKQVNYQESEKKLFSIKNSALQQEATKIHSDTTQELVNMQKEYDNLCLKKKQLLEVKNTKDREHKVLRDELTEYLKNLQQKFIGLLATGTV